MKEELEIISDAIINTAWNLAFVGLAIYLTKRIIDLFFPTIED